MKLQKYYRKDPNNERYFKYWYLNNTVVIKIIKTEVKYPEITFKESLNCLFGKDGDGLYFYQTKNSEGNSIWLTTTKQFIKRQLHNRKFKIKLNDVIND